MTDTFSCLARVVVGVQKATANQLATDQVISQRGNHVRSAPALAFSDLIEWLAFMGPASPSRRECEFASS